MVGEDGLGLMVWAGGSGLIVGADGLGLTGWD